MKFIINTVIGIVLCIAAQTYLPWWWIFAVVMFLFSLLSNYSSGKKSFFAGFVIVFLSWLCLYLLKDAANDSLLSKKISGLFSLPNQYVLFSISSLVMALLGGLSSLSAYFLRKK